MREDPIDTASDSSRPCGAAQATFSKSYKCYVLALLTIVYTMNMVDRGMVVLFMEPIKQDLNLSDTQMGFLTGIAFALFYATLGIPIARLADHSNRGTLTSLAIGLWGLTVMACLFVTNFVQLVAARIAAAVGESGCMPPTYSLLGDYFPQPGERAWAMSIWWLASPLAAVIAYIFGSLIAASYGWRWTFFIMGIPALALAVLVKLTVVDPREELKLDAQPEPLPPMKAVLTVLWRQRTARHLSIGLIVFFTVGYGLGQWSAAYLTRSHGMDTAELGLWFGVIYGVSGITGILLGGYVAARLAGDRENRLLHLMAALMVLLVPAYAIFLLPEQRYVALPSLMPLVVATNFVLGPAFALMQRLVASEMRATTMAIIMLLGNLIGMGLGPQLVGIFSDLLAPHAGEDSLRYAMLIVSFVSFWSAYHFWVAARLVREDLADVAARERHAALASGSSVGRAPA